MSKVADPFCERCGIPFDWTHDIPCDTRAELAALRKVAEAARIVAEPCIRGEVNPDEMDDLREALVALDTLRGGTGDGQ